MAEHDGAAVVCHKCKGTGCYHFTYTYTEFSEKKEPFTKVKRVYEVNPGIIIGEGNNHTLEEFGGITLDEWKNGVPFTPGTENRKYTCPAWWYQSADYDRKPKWNKCMDSLGSTFSKCPISKIKKNVGNNGIKNSITAKISPYFNF